MNKTTIADRNTEKTKQTYSQIYQDYASRNSNLNEDIKRMLDRFILLLEGKAVLDIGCANGRESKYLLEQGLEVTGCDISEEFVKMAQKNCPGGKFFVSDMRNLSLEKKFDGLWVSASFLHVPKSGAEETLKRFFKVLNLGGILYVSVMKGEFNGLRPNTDLGWPERHFSDYGEEEIKGLMKTAGFNIVDCELIKVEWGPTFLHIFCKKYPGN